MIFDVLTAPWIPVVYADGRTEEVGLRTALAEAGQIRAITDPLPTVEFGLYRLLVALVLDIYRPEDLNDLGELLARGAFDTAVLDAYCAQHADRFNLFHAQYPFLQTGGMDGEDAKPLAGLVAAIPSGTNAAHFHHAHEESFGVGPAAAARLLTTLAPFMTAGGAGLSPSVNGAPPWYVLISGTTLFETLCLNAGVIVEESVKGDGVPAWRQDAPPATTRAKQASLLEGLTWRPRRIQLIPGDGGVCSLTGREEPVIIRAMRFTAGASVDFVWSDPSVAYRITDKGRMPMRPQEDHELWRDTGPLALLRENDYDGKSRFERPRLVTQATMLLDQRYLAKATSLNLTVYGMRTDMKMKVFEWQRERLTVPVGVVREGVKGGMAQAAMVVAEDVAYALKQAVKHAYPRQGGGNANAFATRYTHATRRYWHALRGEFDQLLYALATLPAGEDYETAKTTALASWRTAIWKQGWRAFDDALNDLDSDADALRRVVEARKLFAKKLKTPLAAPGQLRETVTV